MGLLSVESLGRIERECSKYPPEQRQSAVMSALAIAQDDPAKALRRPAADRSFPRHS